MKSRVALTTAVLVSLSGPALAAFYFEGLSPYTDPPNCNDPYATTCGRYGQVPHENGKAEPRTRKDDNPVYRPPETLEVQPGVRYHTRPGLEK